MALIGLTDVNHYYGDKCVFNKVSFAVENHHRIGLIGHNGCGKTTLLEIIGGRLTPAGGTVHKRKGLHVSYLQQSIDVNSNCSLLDYVLLSHKRLMDLINLIKQLENKLQYDPSPQNMKLLDAYQNEFAALDGYSLEPKAKMILHQLSFPESQWSRHVDSFSGGEKTRIQLAATLLSPAEIFLFDEPTNHLDIKMRDWLENYLNELNVPYIIVSHDRYFLERTTSTTLAFENKTVVSYPGKYSFYEAESLLKQKQQVKAFEAQKAYIEKTEDFIRKNLAGQKTKLAKSRRKSLAKIDIIERPQSNKELNLNIKSAKRSGNIVFNFQDVSFGFPDNLLGKSITQTLYYQDRVAILGENGCGKTTFLQMMINERKPLQGKVVQGVGLTVGYYDQMHIALNNSLTVMQTINNEHPHWSRYEVMSYLAGFGFYEDELEKNAAMLSGGEKARLYLALLVSRKPNLLIMDEPTNHLDIFMIKSLENALSSYDGTIIFVSHDRYFINNIADRFWLFKDKQLKETGRWEELLLQENSPQPDSSVTKNNDDRRGNHKKSKRINPLLLEKKLQHIEHLEHQIAQKETVLEELEMSYTKKETFKDSNKLKEINTNIDRLREVISSLKDELLASEDDYLQYLD